MNGMRIKFKKLPIGWGDSYQFLWKKIELYVDFCSKRMLCIVIFSFKYFAWNSSWPEIRIDFKPHPYYTGSYVFDLQIEEIHSQISGRSQHLLFLSAVVSYLVSVTVLTSSLCYCFYLFSVPEMTRVQSKENCRKQRKCLTLDERLNVIREVKSGKSMNKKIFLWMIRIFHRCLEDCIWNFKKKLNAIEIINHEFHSLKAIFRFNPFSANRWQHLSF